MLSLSDHSADLEKWHDQSSFPLGVESGDAKNANVAISQAISRRCPGYNLAGTGGFDGVDALASLCMEHI